MLTCETAPYIQKINLVYSTAASYKSQKTLVSNSSPPMASEAIIIGIIQRLLIDRESESDRNIGLIHNILIVTE